MAGADFKAVERKVRCKAGQYARIVEAPYSPKNVGKLVFIEEMVSPYMPTGNPAHTHLTGHECSATWLVRAVGAPLYVPDEGSSMKKRHIDTMMVPIDYLTVIDGGLSKSDIQAATQRKRGRPRKQAS